MLVSLRTFTQIKVSRFDVDRARRPILWRYQLGWVGQAWRGIAVGTAIGWLVSRLTDAPAESRLLRLGDVTFATSRNFNVSSVIIGIILVIIYVVFW